MSTTVTTGDEVTADTLSAAVKAADDAQEKLDTLQRRLTSGDLTVTAEELSAQEKLTNHAKLLVEGVRTLWGRRKADIRSKRLKEFAAEVRKKAPKSGDDLVAALHMLEDAAREFKRLADEHDASVREWTRIAMGDFGIENRTGEAGIRIDGGSDLYIDDVCIPVVGAERVLSNVFYAEGPHSPLRVRRSDDEALAATYARLDQIGEGL